MHVRIAWEIYNHQQKAKTDAKSSVSPAALSSAKLGNSSFDLLNKTGVTPGADYIGKRPGPPQDLLRAHNPSSIFPGSLGSVGSVGSVLPPNPFDPLAARDPFGASRYYSSAHLGKTFSYLASTSYLIPHTSHTPDWSTKIIITRISRSSSRLVPRPPSLPHCRGGASLRRSGRDHSSPGHGQSPGLSHTTASPPRLPGLPGGSPRPQGEGGGGEESQGEAGGRGEGEGEETQGGGPAGQGQ